MLKAKDGVFDLAAGKVRRNVEGEVEFEDSTFLVKSIKSTVALLI